MLYEPLRQRSRVLAACVGAALPTVARAQPATQPAQATTITGRVTSPAGQGVAGANVSIPALRIGTATDAAGRYTLTVPADRANGTVMLTVRALGYRAQQAPVALRGGALAQDLALVSAPTTLSEVVVTGAGTASTRERLGTVVSSVDTATLRRAAQPQNVVSALAGTVPNVEVRTQSGEPGASASIKIRGASSVLGANQPLFVVDNQPIDNTTLSTTGGGGSTVAQNRAADLNPSDIESIEVLKGAAAAAIYGARAANGVVLVTTKRGRAGQTRYSALSTETFDRVQPRIPLQRRFGQGSGGDAPACAQGVGTTDCTGSNRAFGPALAAGTPTYDHLTEIFDTGLTADNDLSVSGGGDRTSFYFSGGLLRQNGYLVGPNNALDRASVRLKATQQVAPALQVGGNFAFVDTRGDFVQKGSNTSGLLLGALRTPPDFDNARFLDPVTGLHRSYRYPNPGFGSTTHTRGYDNPFFALANPGNKQEVGRFIGNANADWSPLGWLRVQYTLGADYYADTRSEALPLTSSGRPTGQVTRFDFTNLEIDHNLLATATHAFGPHVTGRALAGQNLNARRVRQVLAVGNDLNAPSPLVLQNTINPQPSLETRSLRHIEGYFGQLEGDLYDQLFLTARVRNDGYSTFGAAHRRATYPAFTAAWTFTRALPGGRDGGALGGVLASGKLRAAYGEVGREPPVYATINAFSPTTLFGSGFGDAVTASQSGQGALTSAATRGNPDLRPERDREAEGGVDLGLFGDRATLGVTYYSKRSSDVILQVPVSGAQTGFFNQLGNGATITNRGLEATLALRLLDRPHLGWDVALQYGRNRGRVVSLAGAEFVAYATAAQNEGFAGSIGSSTVGYAPGVIRGQDFVRCGRGLRLDLDGDGTPDDVDGLCGRGGTNRPGALFIDATGQPVTDPTDRVIADPNPKWTGGLTTTLTLFRRLRLSGLLDTRQGAQVWNGTRGALYNFGTHRDTEIRTRPGTFGGNCAEGNWYRNETVAGPGACTVAFHTPGEWQGWFTAAGGSFGDVQRQFVEDGSFVKLRELSAAYTLQGPWLRSRLGLGTVDVRVAGRNLATWTKYTGLDPEANLGGAEFLTQGFDFFNNPQSRSFVLSVTLTR